MDYLLLIHGKNTGTRFDLTGDSVILGRGQKCTVTLHDPEVSRRHAELRRENHRWYLTDLGSSNGLYVNGRKIKSKEITLGDQIRLGRTVFRFMSTAAGDLRKSSAVSLLDSPDAFRPIADTSTIEPAEDRIIPAGEQFAPPAEGDQFGPTEKSQRDHLNLIYRTIYTISQTLDTDRLLDQIMERIFNWIQIDRGCFILYDQTTNKLIPKAVTRKQGAAGPMAIRSSIINYVISSQDFVSTTDKTKPELLREIHEQGAREAICVPMVGRYGVVGILYIDIVGSQTPDPIAASGPSSPGPAEAPAEEESAAAAPKNYLTHDHVKLMFATAHQVAMALEDTQYYSAMLQSERLAAVGQTVAVLSHHIKNILQGIEGGSYLIRKGLDADKKEMVQKGWSIVEKNQGRISDLILDMLSFSKEREPAFKTADINEVLADVQELLEPRAADFEIKLVCVPDRSIPPFLFDGEQIHRALMNIVSNAIEAIRSVRAGVEDLEMTKTTERLPQGMVRITSSWQPEQKTVSIVVDDNGPGIPEKIRADIFRPFYSVNKSGGTGLGLPVAQKIVQEHNGKLTIADSPDGGARFLIALPFIDKKPAEQAPSDKG